MNKQNQKQLHSASAKPAVMSAEEFQKKLDSMTPAEAVANLQQLVDVVVQAGGILPSAASVVVYHRALHVLHDCIKPQRPDPVPQKEKQIRD